MKFGNDTIFVKQIIVNLQLIFDIKVFSVRTFIIKRSEKAQKAENNVHNVIVFTM